MALLRLRGCPLKKTCRPKIKGLLGSSARRASFERKKRPQGVPPCGRFFIYAFSLSFGELRKRRIQPMIGMVTALPLMA